MSGDRDLPDDPTRPLSRLVETEARRVLSEANLAPDPVRLADGWERRFIADGPRVEEAITLYRELGYEVVADPLRREDMADDCEDCQLLALMQFKTIYTRRPRPADGNGPAGG